jgi:hypothetical protein
MDSDPDPHDIAAAIAEAIDIRVVEMTETIRQETEVLWALRQAMAAMGAELNGRPAA